MIWLSFPLLHFVFTQLIVRSRKQNFASIWFQHSQALECAPLLWDLAFLSETTCSCSAALQPTSQAWGWQNTWVARHSGRTAPWIHAIVQIVRSIECSNVLSCRRRRLFFSVRLVSSALIRNPLPELGVDRVPCWHTTVTQLYLVFTQLSEKVAPSRVM